jgi:hypothetical protein
MKKLTAGASTKVIGFVIALLASSAQAVPTLFFNGTIGYEASSSRLTVASDLTGTADIFPSPALQGTLNFEAELLSTFFGSGYNIGSFGTIASQNDITVFDANSNLLLSGNFSSLSMSGSDNADNGSIFGELTSTGGSLAADFGIGNILALQFNLAGTVFNSSMYNTDFTGLIDGNIQGVPEPSLLALLSMGILMTGFGFTTKKSRTSL